MMYSLKIFGIFDSIYFSKNIIAVIWINDLYQTKSSEIYLNLKLNFYIMFINSEGIGGKNNTAYLYLYKLRVFVLFLFHTKTTKAIMMKRCR